MRSKSHFLMTILVVLMTVSLVHAGSAPDRPTRLRMADKAELVDADHEDLLAFRRSFIDPSSLGDLALEANNPVSPITKGRVLENITSRADGDAFEPLYAVDLTFLTGAMAGTRPSNHSMRPFVSGNGRYLVFTSLASNLVEGDVNGAADIFRLDLQTGEIISVTGGGDYWGGVSQFDGGWGSHRQVWTVSCTYDGNLVCFTTDAAIVSSDTNGTPDVYVANVSAGTFTRVSTSTAGAQAANIVNSTVTGDATPTGAWSFDGVISADGSAVAFVSESAFGNASDGNNGDNLGYLDVFHKALPTSLAAGDLASTLTLVSHEAGNPNLTSANPVEAASTSNFLDCQSQRPWISGNGRWVVYDSSNARIVADGFARTGLSIYAWDSATNTNARMDTLSTGAISPVAVSVSGSSYMPHISPDGKWVTFASQKTLDYAGQTIPRVAPLTPAVVSASGGGGLSGSIIWARTRTFAGSLRSPQWDTAGTAFDPTFFARGGSPTIDDQGNVTWWSFGFLWGDFAHAAVLKRFSAAAPSLAGPQIRVSEDPSGPWTPLRDNVNYGDAFWAGFYDRSFHDVASNAVYFVNQSDNMEPTGNIWGLKNIFKATYNPGTNVTTALERMTNGDPSIPARIALSSPIDRVSRGFNWKASISGNGQFVGFVSHAVNMFSEVQFGVGFTPVNPFGAVVDTTTGVTALATRNSDGTYINPLNFGFLNPGRYTDDDHILGRDPAGMPGGVAVENDGGFSFQEISTFNGTGAVATSFVVRAPSQAGATTLITAADGTNELGYNFILLNDQSTMHTPSGAHIVFNGDSDSLVSTDDIVPGGPQGTGVFAAYRYEVGTNSLVLASIGRGGAIPDDTTGAFGVSDDGNQVGIYVNDASNFGSALPTSPDNGRLLWVRNISGATTSLVSCSATGQPGGNFDGSTVDTLNGPFLAQSWATMSGDGNRVMWRANANNLVTGFTDINARHVYLKTRAGNDPDTGAVTVVSANLGGGTTMTDTTGLGFGVALAGTNQAFWGSSDPGQVTGDANGSQVDQFRRIGSGAATVASDNALSEQSQVGSAVLPSATTAGSFTWVAFLMDGGDLRTTTPTSAAGAYGDASFAQNLYLKRFYNLGTAADSTWEMFE